MRKGRYREKQKEQRNGGGIQMLIIYRRVEVGMKKYLKKGKK